MSQVDRVDNIYSGGDACIEEGNYYDDASLPFISVMGGASPNAKPLDVYVKCTELARSTYDAIICWMFAVNIFLSIILAGVVYMIKDTPVPKYMLYIYLTSTFIGSAAVCILI